MGRLPGANKSARVTGMANGVASLDRFPPVQRAHEAWLFKLRAALRAEGDREPEIRTRTR